MKTLRIVSLVTGLVLGAGVVSTPVMAADWTVDAGKSKIGFAGTQAGAAFSGQFTHWDAKISFDPANLSASHAEVVIDPASASTGDKQRDEALPQEDWFNVKKYPQARFEAKSFRAVGGDRYEAAGSLTIKGQSRDVTLPFTLQNTGNQSHVVGQLEIERNAFNVGEGAWAAPTFVGAKVTISIDLTATKK